MIEYSTHYNTPVGLELAKYVLMRLVDNQSVETISKDLDDDMWFVNSIVEFLKDIEWVKQDQTSGLYKMTEVGKTKARPSKVIVWI